MTTETSWHRLRSDIYIRDKGMCWICNTFVNLEDYDLGHLIDRCNGGHDDYDNLAVMHKSCNLNKPMHISLEDALKWKLTAFIPEIREARGSILKSTIFLKQKRTTEQLAYVSPLTQFRRQELYKEQLAKIKPSTICWVQGRPMGGAMWRVSVPPYKQEDMFTMRMTPPGAIDNGLNSIQDTLQVIGGKLEQEVELLSGHYKIRITPNNDDDTLSISHIHTERSNVNSRGLTVGMGKRQIPLEQWELAKRQGISLPEFRARYSETSRQGS